MIKVDGSIGSGSGTILRLSLAFSAILNEELHIFNIRAKRSPSGLRPQHLKAVLTAAKICNAKVKNAKVGAKELWFKPNGIRGGKFKIEIGTAGSIPMLFLTVLPISIFTDKPVEIQVSKGGTDVHRSPTINYLKYILLPVLRLMNIHAEIEIKKYGYYPKGMGEAILKVNPTKSIKSIDFSNRGKILSINGISICTFLKDRRVAERQAKSAINYLKSKGIECSQIKIHYDFSNPLQKGSSIVLWAETECKSRIGADAIGAIRKPSEVVGREAAEKLLIELNSKASIDTHLADMLIPYMAFAKNSSIYTVRSITEHISTNIRLCESILGVEFKVKRIGKIYRVERR